MKQFFDIVRQELGSLNQSQVEGLEFLVRQLNSVSFIRHKAYILATVWHETARTMQPIREFGKGSGKKYGVPDSITGKTYYGRGYVQLTWKDNYDRATKKLRAKGLIDSSVNLVDDPDLAMRPVIAAHILILGMTEGWFTGAKLSDYDSYENMRRVVNLMDKAKTIAGYAEIFEKALSTIKHEPVQPDVEDIVEVEKPLPKEASNNAIAIIVGAIAAIAGAIAAFFMNGGN